MSNRKTKVEPTTEPAIVGNTVLAAVFNPLVEILVDENLDNNNIMPRVFVSIDFGLMLRVGDTLFFEEEGEEQPKWIQKWEDYEQLFDWAITLTQRNILSDRIQFYAKRS